MINVLYTLIIFPIEQIIEICFFYCNNWFGSRGVAILGVSVAVSTLILPIYLMADKQQRRQREIENGLQKGVDLIKSTFKGDERFMMLQTYYRQNNYHPIFALRNSIDLLIQIPFFIAAYHFLSHLGILKGAPFLFIHDLGGPDKLLFGLNLLPIVMTLINVTSGMIYAKNLTSKDKTQLYVMSGVFFALLYNSPAGLVLYWTSNNVYNLIKNIILGVTKTKESVQSKKAADIKDNALNDGKTFALALLALTLLIGLVIPSGVISSSVSEFSESASGNFISPLRFVIHTILQAGGFLFWGICLFFLFQGKAKRILTTAVVSLLVMSIMDTFVFWRNYGFLTPDLILSNYVASFRWQQNSTLAVIIALSGAAWFLMYIKRKQIIISLLFIAIISFAIFGAINIVKINTAFARFAEPTIVKDDSKNATEELSKVFHFSKNGKNVIILMLDRAQSQHLPIAFAEKPELIQSFRGFTYYPNMVSFGGHTCVGAPALFGGYYYTPEEIQKRNKELLITKYEEALQVLPRIMAQNDFDVVATDLPFEKVETYVQKVFSDTKNIEVKNIVGHTGRTDRILQATSMVDKYIDLFYRGRLSVNNNIIEAKDYAPVLKKFLFQFSLFKCAPYAMRTKVYNNGNYMGVDNNNRNRGYTRELIRSYIALLMSPEMTQITDDSKNRCAIVVNNLVHSSDFFNTQNYKLFSTVTNKGNGILSNNDSYHVFMLSFLLISKWFDYLKENDVWDNTRVVIMSDHGFRHFYNPIPENITLPNGDLLQRFNSLLLVKDFGATEDFKIDSSFMTGADVPSIATKDIIENPINPFTQKPLYTDKDNGVLVPTTDNIHISRQGKYAYKIKNNEWLKVKENIFKEENWTQHYFEK